jgi:hypothetical protein
VRTDELELRSYSADVFVVFGQPETDRPEIHSSRISEMVGVLGELISREISRYFLRAIVDLVIIRISR